MRLIWGQRKAEYFSRAIWTGGIGLKARRKLAFWRKSFFGASPGASRFAAETAGALALPDAGAEPVDRSPSPSRTAARLRPRRRRRCHDVGGRIMIGKIRRQRLASHVGGEQTLDIGKAGQIAQKVAPSPGPAVSSVTSAHDDTRSSPEPRDLF
jgi:hypothetical protein